MIATNTTDWRRLQNTFDALVGALHDKHVHAKICIDNCTLCRAMVRTAYIARLKYDLALHETIG
mgnify:FL=1